MYHTVNKHELGEYKHFKRCAHEPYTMEESKGRDWLEEGSDAYKAIDSIFKDKKFKSDCKYLTEAIHTTKVEVFVNIILKYLPKQYHFEYDHMVMGTCLTALDNNFNSDRGQDTIKSGENIGKCKYKIAWKKTTQKRMARKVCQKKQYGNFKIMMKSVHKYIEKHEQEDREELIKKIQLMTRF